MFRVFILVLAASQACLHNEISPDEYEKAANASDIFVGGDREDLLVLECIMENQEQRNVLNKLVNDYDIDLWSERIPTVNTSFSMLLTDSQVPLLQQDFSCLKPKPLALYKLERTRGTYLLTNERDQVMLVAYNKTGVSGGFYDDYQGYTAIIQELKVLSQNYGQVVSKFESLGQSIENRSIPVVHLNANNTSSDKPVIWYAQRHDDGMMAHSICRISGGQHAREWVAVSSVMYVLDRLIKGYGSDTAITEILNSFEFAIAPVINPDGYEFSRGSDRLWRKNRRRNQDGTMGVDLNRNWDSHWGEVGSSRIPGTQIYQGRREESEPEVNLTAKYIRSLKNRAAGIDVHSFGQYILRNYGWTIMATTKETYLKRLGDSIANSMNSLYQSGYVSQRSSALYPSGGSMDDWMFDKAEMPGFTIELRDHGEYGFVLPPEFIRPTGEELLAGVLALAQAILDGREM